tara:strand:+ start:83 stop:1249 length:1167 start_codon:yes stop_codon:yes gene_type:complete
MNLIDKKFFIRNKLKNTIRKFINKLYCLPWKVLSKIGIYSGKGSPIQFVSEKANWAIQTVGKQIKKEIDIKNPNFFDINHNPSMLTKQVVHFGSQYMWLSWGKYMSKDNYFITSFFHGKPSDGFEVEKHIEDFLKSMPKLNKVITSSTLVENRLLDWGVKREKLIKIPLGVDTKKFKTANNESKNLIKKEYKIPSNSILIGSFQKDGIGWKDGLKPKFIKGPDIFIEVIKGLKNKGFPVFVVLTGPARGFVKEKLKENKIPFIHKYVSNIYELIPLYQILDIYLITSREEGGPMGLLESIACGSAVVSTNVGMAKDVIEDGINGFIADDFHYQSIIDKSVKFIEMPIKNKLDILQKGRKNILNYDWEIVSEMHLEKVYKPAYNFINRI